MAKKTKGNQQKGGKSAACEIREPIPSSDDDSVSSEEEGEDLILEGVLVRNADVDSSDNDSESEEEKEPGPLKKKTKTDHNQSSKSKKSKSAKKKEDSDGTDIIPVEFTFNDMNEKFFHGIKNHLLSQSIYASFSSELSDTMIENVSVGTVVSTDDGEDNVFGFASVLNVATHGDKDSIKYLKKICLNGCPKEHIAEMETVLSGKTKRPAGVLVHGRMVNLPLEITLVLHEQLVLDMDWAVKNAHGGEEVRKSLDFGAFVLLAPCTRDNTTHAVLYKNFDDEIFAGCAEFVYTISTSEVKIAGGVNSGENHIDGDMVAIIVCTKTGHRQGMNELKSMIHG